MHTSTKRRRALTLPAAVQFRLTEDEKTALESGAELAGLTLSEYIRKVVLDSLTGHLVGQTSELLRVMDAIVNQKMLALVQSGTKITDGEMEAAEREAARRAQIVLQRRLWLLERMEEEAKWVAA